MEYTVLVVHVALHLGIQWYGYNTPVAPEETRRFDNARTSQAQKGVGRCGITTAVAT